MAVAIGIGIENEEPGSIPDLDKSLDYNYR
jgi:hypothetical protein